MSEPTDGRDVVDQPDPDADPDMLNPRTGGAAGGHPGSDVDPDADPDMLNPRTGAEAADDGDDAGGPNDA